MAGSSSEIDIENVQRRLKVHLSSLCEDIGIRSVLTYANLCRAEEYVARAFEGTGYGVQRQQYRFAGMELANLIARDPGCSPRGRQYILCAHYDSAPGTPGADDNASSVAILLEVARLAREQVSAAWQFIAFTAEEPPTFHTRFQGSRVFAHEARRAALRIDGVVNLEMLGRFLDSPNSQRLPFPLGLLGYPRVGNFAAVVGNWKSRGLTRRVVAALRRNPKLPVEYVIVPERGFSMFAVRLSDHSSFWDLGYPAVMVTDTAFYRNPHYHTMADTVEKLNVPAMAEVVRSLLSFVAATPEI